MNANVTFYSLTVLKNKAMRFFLFFLLITCNVLFSTAQNTPQSKKRKAVSPSKPAATDKQTIYYYVKEKETLYKISKMFDISVDSLKLLNKLKKDNLNTGQRLIVGYYGKMFPEKPDTIRKPSPVQAKPKIAKDTSKSFTGQGKEVKEQGVASWIQDEDVNPNKFIALHRTAPLGTMIKVINKMNRRVVLVKVVGSLPATGDNANLVIKISKAAAQKLDVRDPRFQCELSYALGDN
jgi:rare lipoprotein A (peptidoglycan hydrolase)